MSDFLTIKINRFDNEPFVRSLTASMQFLSGTEYIPATGADIVKWQFDTSTVWARNLSGGTYASNTTASVSSIGTMVFYLTADTYDFTVATYNLLQTGITATHLSANSVSAYDIVYDTFPNLTNSLTVFINYENTDNSSYFYRLTSTQDYLFQYYATTQSLDLDSVTYRSSIFDTWSTINNTGTRITNFSSISSFNPRTPSVCSIQVYVSAISAINTFGPWYTPHIFTKDISARFVPFFLTADFIGYPSLYFADFQTQVRLTSSNYFESPGMFFYGEGHTETINLSARLNNNIQRYIWTVGSDNTEFYTVTSVDLSGARSRVNITTQIGSYPTIPVSLFVTNNQFLTSGPYYFYPEELSGQPAYYPFYISTVNLTGGEISTNTNLRQSIRVNSYETPLTSFNPGISGTITLPKNNQLQTYIASLNIGLSGTPIPGNCYDKYGLLWKWSTFSECSAFSFTGSRRLSSWANTQCLLSAGATGPLSSVSAVPGPFPKKWRNEGALSATAFTPSPVLYTASNITWTLSAPLWEIDTIYPYTVTDYVYFLKFAGIGQTLFTVNEKAVTPVTIRATQTAFGYISAFPYDWQTKSVGITGIETALVLPDKKIKIYTPNRYVLTGTEVKFENLSEGLFDVNKVVFDLNDNTNNTILTGNNLTNSLYATYTETGTKTVQATAYLNNGSTFTVPFTSIINVVNSYDQVVLENYRTKNSELILPWSQKPQIMPNEWAIADNINSIIKKFVENLEYLENRSKEYETSITEFFGWLGTPNLSGSLLSSCPVYTWEDLDCLEINNNKITWQDAQEIQIDRPDITENGFFSSCGTWSNQTCNATIQNPNCLGKHCVEWKWKSRKCATAREIITWKDTRCNQPFSKKWYFEPCEVPSGEALIGTFCGEGYWNVNINGLDNYYNPINNCEGTLKCYYRSIATRNNIIYAGIATELKVLSSDYTATPIASRQTLDDINPYRDIKAVDIDSQGKVYVLDAGLSRVGSYIINPDEGEWLIFSVWGGVGTSNSQTKFSNPRDLHIDANDYIWVTDTGNKCIKQYSNSGSWLQTIKDDFFQDNEPVSVAVDSSNNLHVLTNKEIRIYSYEGNYIKSYTFANLTNQIPIRIKTNFNREVIYVVFSDRVLKFFKNSVYYGEIINNKQCATNINDAVQDSYRNVIVTAQDKLVKFVDIMEIRDVKGPLPDAYWSLNDLLIHKNEYIQNWVYNKSFQRLWDNIEFFRNSLIFENTGCRKYVGPVYSKNDILIGQNEIVTSAVVNRIISYLWTNFNTLINYFDPNCTNT